MRKVFEGIQKVLHLPTASSCSLIMTANCGLKRKKRSIQTADLKRKNMLIKLESTRQTRFSSQVFLSEAAKAPGRLKKDASHKTPKEFSGLPEKPLQRET